MFRLLLCHGFSLSDRLHPLLELLVFMQEGFISNFEILSVNNCFETRQAFKIINPTLILSLSLALAAVCLSCIPLGRFSCWVHFYTIIIFENRFGSPISGYYAYWYWYQEWPRELLQVDCNQLYWAFGELISQEHSCKHMDRGLKGVVTLYHKSYMVHIIWPI